jgi:hypothetical protein
VADARQHDRTRRASAGEAAAADGHRHRAGAGARDRTLNRIDDFVVSLTTAGGDYRSFRITPRTKVDVSDALAPHKDLLRKYTDADIHNVTLFLPP